jgi:RNA 2',3'-cyclic 3'-phosphodiesterase
MRFFIALEIPETSKRQLEEVQEKIITLIPEVRLTNPEKLHLTLAFIGERPDDLKESLIEVIKNAALEMPSFEITPAYLDGFPNIHHPNTLWVGVKGDIDKLLIIRERIKDGLKALDLIVDERRFTPHIAIGKLTNYEVSVEQELELERIMVTNFDPIAITSIKLFESSADEGLHIHNTLAEIQLVN